MQPSVNMAEFDGYQALSQVSNQTTEAEIRQIYDNWATNYEMDTNSHGYVAHKTCTDVFDAEMAKAYPKDRLSLRVMDAGAGTGIVGEHLQQLGYTNVDGLDISQEMLNIARQKRVYKNLICAGLSETEIAEIADGQYEGIVCSGTITVAHVKAASLGELRRWLKPGGIICFTIRQDALELPEYGYKQKIDEMVTTGTWEMRHKSLIQYHSKAGVKGGQDNCFVLVFKAT
ncbi:uncharacterized protein LOC5517919 isoform X2 [Nematostella vectensis]|uniref:uncharacterized protein LOC5517919 isoform X2 n=1 Tax=Nematostella vectensis TaxID=45351 RepID=UPI0020778601|nr:uncharacterized protein LOC5517919 isoform X2 [Nematostella vectensis]